RPVRTAVASDGDAAAALRDREPARAVDEERVPRHASGREACTLDQVPVFASVHRLDEAVVFVEAAQEMFVVVRIDREGVEIVREAASDRLEGVASVDRFEELAASARDVDGRGGGAGDGDDQTLRHVADRVVELLPSVAEVMRAPYAGG